MSKSANPTVIGAFVVGALVLLTTGVMLFGGTELFLPKDRLLTYFPNTVKGLRVGANVLFRGVRVGFVEDIQLQGDANTLETLVQVTLRTLPGQIQLVRNNRVLEMSSAQIDTQEFIDAGVRAQLGIDSFVTGQLLVELDFFPDSPEVFRGDIDLPYPEIPTIPNNIQQFVDSVQKLLQTVDFPQVSADLQSALRGMTELTNSEDLRETLAGANRLVNSEDTQALSARLGQTLADTRQTLESAKRLADNADAGLVGLVEELTPVVTELEDTLEAARTALHDASQQIRGDTELGYQLVGTLEEVQSTARTLRVFLDYIDRHPEALLRGKPAQE